MTDVTITKDDVVAAHDWPGTRGKRFLVLRISQDGYAQIREIGGGGKLRLIETDHLTVDAKATRARKDGGGGA